MSCTGPTLYPVVLSSIDGECVFAEYDLSTAVNVTNWQNIHDVVMWCCPWLYYDPPNDATTPGPIPTGSIKPNTADPATTYTVWMHHTGKIGDSNFPQGEGLVDHSNQFTQLAGGETGVGTAAYWTEVNPSHEALFYLELGNEVETSAAPAKITMGVSSVSGGPEGYRLGIDPTQTVSYSGTDGTVEDWGIAGSSKWSYKFQPANNRSLESLVNVKSSATSGATNGQLLTFNGTRWQASAAPTGGGGSFALSDGTDVRISDSLGNGDILVYDIANAKWVERGSVRIDAPGGDAIISAQMIAGQTSAVFTASNSAGDAVFKMDGTGSFKVSGSVSAAIVSGTEGKFLTVTGIDHGGLGGLGDDDHPQYVLSATNNALSSAYTNHAASASVHFTEGSIDHGSIAGLGDDDHTQYIYNAPATSNRNLITQGHRNYPPLEIKRYSGGNSDLLQILDSGGVTMANIDKDSNLATVSGSIKGATVSGTTVKGINGSFTGDVSAASGVNDGSLATMDMFSRMFAHTAYRSGSFSASQTIFFYLNTNDQDANFVIPAGMTLKILAAYGRCKSGGSAGTTTFTIRLRAWTDDAHSSYATYDLANGSTTSTNSYFHFYDHGTMESPLASIVGSSNPVGEVGLTHAGPGTSGSDKHTVSVYGVFV